MMKTKGKKKAKPRNSYKAAIFGLSVEPESTNVLMKRK